MFCKGACQKTQEVDLTIGICPECGQRLKDPLEERNRASNAPILGFGYGNSPWASAFKRDLIDIHWSEYEDVEAKLAKGEPKHGKQKSKVPIRPQIHL